MADVLDFKSRKEPDLDAQAELYRDELRQHTEETKKAGTVSPERATRVMRLIEKIELIATQKTIQEAQDIFDSGFEFEIIHMRNGLKLGIDGRGKVYEFGKVHEEN